MKMEIGGGQAWRGLCTTGIVLHSVRWLAGSAAGQLVAKMNDEFIARIHPQGR